MLSLYDDLPRGQQSKAGVGTDGQGVDVEIAHEVISFGRLISTNNEPARDSIERRLELDTSSSMSPP